MKYIKVKDSKNLVREVASNAIINTDNLEYNKYIEDRNKKTNEINKINSLENEIYQLRSDLDEIKNLLRGLVHGS